MIVCDVTSGAELQTAGPSVAPPPVTTSNTAALSPEVTSPSPGPEQSLLAEEVLMEHSHLHAVLSLLLWTVKRGASSEGWKCHTPEPAHVHRKVKSCRSV